MSAAATPQDEHMEVDGSASASTAQPEVQGPALFQPVPIASEAAYTSSSSCDMAAKEPGDVLRDPLALRVSKTNEG